MRERSIEENEGEKMRDSPVNAFLVLIARFHALDYQPAQIFVYDTYARCCWMKSWSFAVCAEKFDAFRGRERERERESCV